MFRGGRVSSYGTGIAAPLVQGYQSGGQIGGGIIHGLPYEDGRYGFARPKLQNFDTNFILPEMKVGQEIYEETRAKPWLVPTEQESTVELTGEIKGVDQEPSSEIETEVNTTDEYITLPPRGRSKESITILNPDYKPPFKTVTSPGKGRIGEITREVELTDEEIAAEKWTPGLDTPTHIPAVRDTLNLNQEIIETKPEVDARTAVAENKALFADLLGIKEARGQDISDMLLGFAGAEGDTTMDKFQRFAATEAQRPGRRRKISDAAGTLAIQDYVAGKRSKEQIEALKGKMDYDYEQKLKLLIPQKSDSLEVAQLKLASRDISPSSDKGIKYLISIQDDTEMGNKVYTAQKGVKLKDITGKKSKVLKKLLPGYNIITDEKLGKVIIKYDGSGTFGGIKILDISEIWAGG